MGLRRLWQTPCHSPDLPSWYHGLRNRGFDLTGATLALDSTAASIVADPGFSVGGEAMQKCCEAGTPSQAPMDGFTASSA